MRLDRFLTLRLFSTVRRLGSGQGNQWLPILMYHSISDTPENGIHPYYRTRTRPEVFREQIAALAAGRYSCINLEHGLALWGTPELWNSKRVVLTFDDGFRDFYTEAFPCLRRHGFSATVFLPAGFIGAPRRCFKGCECLTWPEVRELRAHGIRFGSHTVNHPELQRLGREEIHRELKDSKQQMEQQLQEAVTTFAHPYAFPLADQPYATMLTELLAEAGYEAAVTTILGRAGMSGDRFRLPRLPVNSCDDLPLLRAKLEGAYDWVGVAQRIFKRCRLLRRARRSPIGCQPGARTLSPK